MHTSILYKPFSYFERINPAYILMFALTASLVFYLFFLYSSFAIGFHMKSANKEIRQLSEQIALDEVQIRQKDGSFFEQNEGVLSSMEKISSISYIGSESFAIASPLSQP